MDTSFRPRLSGAHVQIAFLPKRRPRADRKSATKAILRLNRNEELAEKQGINKEHGLKPQSSSNNTTIRGKEASTSLTHHGSKVDELDRTIAYLQKLNAELQADMQMVVSGLNETMEIMQQATTTHTNTAPKPPSLESTSDITAATIGHAPPKPKSNSLAAAAARAGAAPPSSIHHCQLQPSGSMSTTTTNETAAAAGAMTNGAVATGEPLPPSSHPRHSHHTTSSASSCVVQHPGALCCTNIETESNAGNGTCTITIKTVARCTKDEPESAEAHLTEEEVSALAAQALLAAATDLFRRRTQVIHSHSQPAERQQRHQELCRILEMGKVCSAEYNTPSQFGHPSFIVQLQDPATDRTIKAVFKPRLEGDADGWHRAPMEYVAYKLNLLLGMDLVPPVAYRNFPVRLTIDGEELQYDQGAMMYFVEDADKLCTFPEETWGVSKDLLLSDTRILDVLLHNSDRHPGHFLLGRHWCLGSWEDGKWVGEMRPVLIDHAASFRKDAHVSMEHENAFQTGPVKCVGAHSYLRLRFLDAASVSKVFTSFLSDDEVVSLVQRRNYVLRYLDRLVDTLSYQSVVRDASSS